MSHLQARIGRQRQRYEDGVRLVAGCIPYRFKTPEDATDAGKWLEVLMVTSTHRDDLVFPKGGWENDETMEDAACREALEEAGIRGKLDEVKLGEWEFRSKGKENKPGPKGYCKGYMFALEVTEELEYWPEQDQRVRRWLSIPEAGELCRYDWMREALKKWQLRIRRRDVKHHLRKDAGVGLLPDAAERQIPLNTCYIKTSDVSSLENPINAYC